MDEITFRPQYDGTPHQQAISVIYYEFCEQ